MGRCPGNQKKIRQVFPCNATRVQLSPCNATQASYLTYEHATSILYAPQGRVPHAPYRTRPGKQSMVWLWWLAQLTEMLIGDHFMLLTMRRSMVPLFLARSGV
jgi:hypothetical protein